MSDSRLSDFDRSLASLLAMGVLPREFVGDLDDLLGASESLRSLLLDLAETGMHSSRAQLESKLYKLQILLEQDLPMIIDDLLPPLRELSGEVLGDQASTS